MEPQVYDVEGHWWHRDADGSWSCWNAQSKRWVPQPSPPPSLRKQLVQSAADPVSSAVFGSSMGAGLGDPGWFGQAFPPYSVKRWVFLMVVLPIVAVVVEMIEVGRSGEPFSWLTVGIVTFLGESTLAVAWSASTDRDRAPNSLPEPWRGLLIFVGCMVFILITEALWGLETPSQLSELGIVAVVAATMTSIWYVRHTVLAPIIIAALVSWPVAGLIHLFTYWLGATSFPAVWAFSFVMALPFVFPMWASIVRLSGGHVPLLPDRRPRNRQSTVKPPAWMMIALGCLFAWTPAVFTDSVDERRSRPSIPSDMASNQGVSTSEAHDGAQSLPELAGAPGREAAARQLMDAWKLGDRALATRVALQAPLDALFAIPRDANAWFGGCDISTAPATCRIATAQGDVVLEVELHPQTNWFYVTGARLVPEAAS